MNRRILALIAVLALVGTLVPAMVFAADAGTVTCTVSAAVVTVSVSPGNVTYGALSCDEQKNTAQYDAINNIHGMTTPQTQTITNTGNVDENFAIATSNAVGVANWSLGYSGPGADQFMHACRVTATAYNGTTPIDNFVAWEEVDTGVLVATAVPPAGTRYLELLIWTPTFSSDPGNHTITVTILATQSGT